MVSEGVGVQCDDLGLGGQLGHSTLGHAMRRRTLSCGLCKHSAALHTF